MMQPDEEDRFTLDKQVTSLQSSKTLCSFFYCDTIGFLALFPNKSSFSFSAATSSSSFGPVWPTALLYYLVLHLYSAESAICSTFFPLLLSSLSLLFGSWFPCVRARGLSRIDGDGAGRPR